MGKLFTLDATVKQVIQDALDDLLVDSSLGGLGKTCSLVYPPRLTPCENCIIDPVSGRSMNRPRDGAPQPFVPGQNCPLCGGKGLKEQEVTEQIVLGCNWEAKRFTQVVQNIDVRVPYGLVEVKGFLTDLPKILKAAYLVFQLPVAPYLRGKYKLSGEPADRSNIIQARYFFAVFERVNA